MPIFRNYSVILMPIFRNYSVVLEVNGHTGSATVGATANTGGGDEMGVGSETHISDDGYILPQFGIRNSL